MAQALFNHHNKDERFKAVSAGMTIAAQLNPVCVKAMYELGIDMSNIQEYYPKQTTTEMIERAHKIFTMGCNVVCDTPPGSNVDGDWDLKDPAGKSLEKVRKIRNQVQKNVLSLIKELEEEDHNGEK